jgi:acetate kinase
VNRQIVVINSGSATVKFAGYEMTDNAAETHRLYRGIAEWAGDGARFRVANAEDTLVVDESIDTAREQSSDVQPLLDHALKWLQMSSQHPIAAFGHRVVHGGDAFSAPILLDDAALSQLESYVPLAPLHQPFNLEAIRTIKNLWPDTPQVACFDTAFHQTQPRVARMFGLPLEYFDKGIKRYGFHGLSYEFIARVLPDYMGEAAEGRVVVAHLGSGASLCAMRNRKSVATTMGFTALDGLVMGTRCGNIDPGVILYLMDEEELDSEQLAGLLYRHSGLLGVSGISADMRELLTSDSRQAADAIELFVYAAVRQIGALIAALGGLDALIFTGGIGTHSAPIRQRICEQSEWAGIKLNLDANAAQSPRISADNSPVSVWVITTDEEQVIADHTLKLISTSQLTQVKTPDRTND